MLRSSLSKAVIALTLLTALNACAVPTITEQDGLCEVITHPGIYGTSPDYRALNNNERITGEMIDRLGVPAVYNNRVAEEGLEYAIANAGRQLYYSPLTQITTLNPVEVLGNELAKAAQFQNSLRGRAICAFRSFKESAGSFFQSAAPQTVINFCKQNPKTVGAGILAVAALGTAAYLYAKGFFSKANASTQKAK